MLNPPIGPSRQTSITTTNTLLDRECGKGCMTSSQRMMTISILPAILPIMSPGPISLRPRPRETGLRGRVGVGLPRQTTFKRQNSEKRDRLCPIEPCPDERRAVSHSRISSASLPRPRSNSTPVPSNPARTSAPAVPQTVKVDASNPNQDYAPPQLHTNHFSFVAETSPADPNRPDRPPSITSSITSREERFAPSDNKAQINSELDTRWILNLSMHFRDKSDREKFFVTYAQSPTNWRRVTVSCDYRNAEPGSLEMDLKELQFQRDKSLQIYESIRDSLPEIQFYDTVTNLKLETSEGRLHVHVTEDTNEVVPYPPRATVAHILQDEHYRPMEIPESELMFDSHLSGFVYKVKHEDRVFIKKEIPGPDTVDEFLYEINALHALHGSENVIQLEAIVVNDSHQIVKGLLISYAEQGALVDLLYDHKGKISWEERLRWARDSVVGLSEIHQEGYIQGDFTLSNIVVDGEGNAKIIDINRRGCPVGWEPPEIATKIASHQRISMYIGEKSDLYQLGMTLWGLAADDDEPERHDPPLRAKDLPSEIPGWYRDIVNICLSKQPRDRLAAKELARMFRSSDRRAPNRISTSLTRPDVRDQKRYIDPAQAVERDDIEKLGQGYQHHEILPYSPESSRYDDTFTYPRSSNYDRGSDISAFDRPRGRTPPTNLEHLSRRERYQWTPEEVASPSADDLDAQIVSVSPRLEPDYQQIDFDGRPFLIARNTFSDAELQILEHNPNRDQPRNEQQTGDPSGTMSGLPDFARRRPALESRTSATSSSTPRNSQAILPDIGALGPADSKAWAPSGLHDVSDNEFVQDKSQDSQTLLGAPLNRRDSSSPQPPPSLTYADSGFHEPLHFGEEADYRDTWNQDSGAVRKEMPEDISGTDAFESIEPGRRASQLSPQSESAMSRPPPLLRSDTSIKIGSPDAELPPMGKLEPSEVTSMETPIPAEPATLEPIHDTIHLMASSDKEQSTIEHG